MINNPNLEEILTVTLAIVTSGTIAQMVPGKNQEIVISHDGHKAYLDTRTRETHIPIKLNKPKVRI